MANQTLAAFFGKRTQLTILMRVIPFSRQSMSLKLWKIQIYIYIYFILYLRPPLGSRNVACGDGANYILISHR